MNCEDSSVTYKRHRYPREIIAFAVFLYYRMPLSYRNIEDILAYRQVQVSYEAMRSWCLKFGAEYTRRIRRRRRGQTSNVWHMDEVFVRIGGRMRYLWRAVDSEGNVLDILVQARRNRKAAYKFFRKVLKSKGYLPATLVTDKYVVYKSARAEYMTGAEHITKRWSNNRAENSHQPTRQQERQQRRFPSAGSAQRFLATHSAVHNHFSADRHLTTASVHREIRRRCLAEWSEIVELTGSK